MADINFETKYANVRVNGEMFKIAYWENYSQNKNEYATPVIFAHGLTSSKGPLSHTLVKEFLPEANRNELNARLISFDWPGHGQSSAAKQANFDLLVETLAAFMDELKIQKAHIYGMSLGGIAAVKFAARYPHRILTMASQGTPIDSKDMLSLANPFSLARALKGLFKNMPAELYVMGSVDMARLSKKAFVSYVKNLTAFNLYNELKQIKLNDPNLPVFLVDGAHPEHKIINTIDRLEQLLEGSNTYAFKVPGTGHLASISHPSFVAKRYAAFLADEAKNWHKTRLRVIKNSK